MVKNVEEDHWDMVIEGKTSLFDLKFKDIWRYRDLLGLLVKRDFISVYKQTILGPLWFFIQPIFTTIIFTVIFGNLAGISTDGIPQPLFYLSGITAWNYFADCLNKTSTVFSANAGIFGKVYFPRLIMPLSIIVSNLVKFGIQFLLFLAMLLYFVADGYAIQLNTALFLFPLLVMMMAMFGLGIGLIITAMTTKYKDLAMLVGFGVQLLMYATPVIYPLSASPEKFRPIISANPMSAIIEAFRAGFLGQGAFEASSLLYSISVIALVFIVGIVIFNKTERSFVDTI
jgi:lipopolysaccharide transport system permease protein